MVHLSQGIKLVYTEVTVSVSTGRKKVRFVSDGTECAAWYYPGTNGGCVIMTGRLAVPKEPGTDAFAGRTAAADSARR